VSRADQIDNRNVSPSARLFASSLSEIDRIAACAEKASMENSERERKTAKTISLLSASSFFVAPHRRLRNAPHLFPQRLVASTL
jgi:hypothetical protein